MWLLWNWIFRVIYISNFIYLYNLDLCCTYVYLCFTKYIACQRAILETTKENWTNCGLSTSNYAGQRGAFVSKELNEIHVLLLPQSVPRFLLPSSSVVCRSETPRATPRKGRDWIPEAVRFRGVVIVWARKNSRSVRWRSNHEQTFFLICEMLWAYFAGL